MRRRKAGPWRKSGAIWRKRYPRAASALPRSSAICAPICAAPRRATSPARISSSTAASTPAHSKGGGAMAGASGDTPGVFTAAYSPPLFMILYAATIFLSAFLLFQVQPLIAKIILPWFGGTAAVWTICILFFQLLLLAGYVYSHAYVRLRIPGRRYIHIALLALAAATLPLAAGAAWKPSGGEDPTWRILGLLATSVGLPYFMQSTTGPLLQAWYARAHQGATPYRLFALSN